MFLSPIYSSLLPAWLCPPFLPAWRFCISKNPTHPSQKQHHVSPFLFPSPHPHFHAATRKSCRVFFSWAILFFPEQRAPRFSQWVAHALFGRDVAIQMEHPWWTGQGICQDRLSRDIWLDEILATFHSKRLCFLYSFIEEFFSHTFQFQAQSMTILYLFNMLKNISRGRIISPS